MSRFDDLLVKGKSSAYFKASYDLESYERDMALSERQLFTQSNGRVLLGQDTLGRMHFIAAPHELDYVLPTGKRKSSQHITCLIISVVSFSCEITADFFVLLE